MKMADYKQKVDQDAELCKEKDTQKIEQFVSLSVLV